MGQVGSSTSIPRRVESWPAPSHAFAKPMNARECTKANTIRGCTELAPFAPYPPLGRSAGVRRRPARNPHSQRGPTFISRELLNKRMWGAPRWPGPPSRPAPCSRRPSRSTIHKWLAENRAFSCECVHERQRNASCQPINLAEDSGKTCAGDHHGRAWKRRLEPHPSPDDP